MHKVCFGKRMVARSVNILAVAWFCVSAAAAQESMTLSDAIRMAIANHPRLEAARTGVEVAAASLDQARARYLPHVAASETWTRGNNPVFVFGSKLEQEQFTERDFALGALNDPDPLDNFRSALELRLPLFDRLQTVTGVSRARIAHRRAGQDRTQAEQEIRLLVVRAYYGTLLAEAEENVAADSVASAEAEVTRIADLYSQGVVTEADLGAAQVQLADFRQRAIAASGATTTARATLATVLGVPDSPLPTPAGSLDARSFEPFDESTLVTRALERRPEARQARLDVAGAEQGVKAALGGYLPRVDFSASYGVSGHQLDDGSTDYLLGTRMSLDLFDAARHARLAEARARLRLAAAVRRQREDEIRLEIIEATERFRSAQKRSIVAARAVEQARATLAIVEDRYEVGLTTVTELLRAQTARLRARTSALGAQFDEIVGYAEVLRATGTLDDASRLEPAAGDGS